MILLRWILDVTSVFTSNRMYSTILKVFDLRLQRITKSMNEHSLETFFLFRFVSEWLVANCTCTINLRKNAIIEKIFIKNLDIVILRMIFIEPKSNFTFPLFFNDSKNSSNIHCMGQKFSRTIERLSDATKQRDYALLDSCHVYCKSCIQTWFETEWLLRQTAISTRCSVCIFPDILELASNIIYLLYK